MVKSLTTLIQNFNQIKIKIVLLDYTNFYIIYLTSPRFRAVRQFLDDLLALPSAKMQKPFAVHSSF